jgi:hypothetical protein
MDSKRTHIEVQAASSSSSNCKPPLPDALDVLPEPAIIAQRKAWTVLTERVLELRRFRGDGELARPPYDAGFFPRLLWELCEPRNRELLSVVMCELDDLLAGPGTEARNGC